jgi:hypothetical protein
MSDPMGHYTLEEILEAGQDNVNSLSFVTIAFLKEQHLSPIDLWHFIGEQFAKQWAQGIDAAGMANGTAINWASIGAKVVEISADPTHSTLVLSAWPPEKVLEKYGTQRDDADAMLEIMRPIASRLGFAYEWKRANDQVILKYTKI